MSYAIRNSKQRRLVLEAVRAERTHPSAEEIYARLKIDHPALSLGTVYRNLAILTKLGEIRKVDVSMPCERYDGNCAPHSHFLCEKCGELYDVESKYADDFLASLPETRDGHRITGVNVIYTGICARCAGRKGGDPEDG